MGDHYREQSPPNVQLCSIRRSILTHRIYVFLSSPLRGMSEVPHSIPDCLQSVLQRVVSRTHCCCVSGRVLTLLLLRETARFQPMEVERGEEVLGFESGAWAWIRNTAGNRAGRRWIEIVRDKRNCSLNPIARERNSNEPDRVKSDSYVAPEYRQFDFWIGDWDVFDVDSPTTRVARIRVDRILDGCVLLGRLSRHRRSERSEFQSLR